MDSITQATLGALCGELLLRKQLGWKGAAWGFFFGTLPDLDIIVSFWLDSMDHLRNHRGLSHSLFLMLAISPLFGFLLTRIHKQLTRKRAAAFVLLTWSTHVLIDCFNSYGTQVFEPFSDYRVTLNNISIIDPLFTLPMLIGLIWGLFYKKESPRRTQVVTLTCSWISAYTLLSFVLLAVAERQFDKQFNSAGIHAEEKFTSCTLGNIFLWRTIARDDAHYYVSYWSVWDAADRLVEIDTIPRRPELAAPYRGSKAFETLDWFSQGWWKVMPDGENSIILADLRFGEMHALETETPQKIPPFLWKLSLEKDGSVTDTRVSLRDETDPKKTLKTLWERIKGDSPDWMSPRWPWDN